MLEIKNLSFSYPKDKKVLDRISLDIGDGECGLFIGESGSGKSSILKSINGLASSYDNAVIEGSVKIDSRDIKDMELYEISKLISSVFQNPKTHFFNVNTTLELIFYLENIGLDKNEIDKRLESMLEIFPISHLLNRDIFELSGGEKQILCLAASYISGTRTILLDEPSSNLDDFYIEKLKEMLGLLKNKGISLIIAEHRIYYLMDLVDKIYMIKDGEIEESYSKEEFLKLEDTYLNELGIRSKEKTKLILAEDKNGRDLLIKELIYKFKGNSILEIKDLSFSLGKIYGIVARNGCGKSTFVRSLIGVDKKSKDLVYYKSELFSKRKRLKNSSLVMQDVNHQLFTDSVESELKVGLKDLKEDKLRGILEELGLTEFKDRHPMSLSGGQKQRLAVASVFSKDSKFIFFDEPTSGMDYKNMLRISRLIKKCIDEDKIIFIISHDLEFLNQTADYIVNLEKYRK